MPVTFVIDPRLPAGVNTIALSYTFFEVAGAEVVMETIKTVLSGAIGIRRKSAHERAVRPVQIVILGGRVRRAVHPCDPHCGAHRYELGRNQRWRTAPHTTAAHGGPGTAVHGRQTHYAVPHPMPWPIMGSASLFMMALGAVFCSTARARDGSACAGFALIST